ncbi:PAS domain-containing protein [Microvirga guangxiensis]|uniref:RNA polymerase sigma factor, sigma-70 family n=1 Tax=Microvirga guangxiensis TaxID=549386 RepID=A0A1G5LI94_9HYPH|nr:PAS domain-containing protein [Microvirga guangxiensis]SCZ12623.1 RNA polymerase sigma factor, sigma-70 family [Microvirga guangxiensis]
MGAKIQAYDWSSSPLGPIETWPEVLRITLGNMLHSAFATYLAWGTDLITFYNDPAVKLRGDRPEALGQPLPKAWSEIWEVVSPMVVRALRGETTYVQDVPIDIVQRRGYPEATWWTGSISPVMDAADQLGGVLIILQETTERVLTEQRLRFLVDLSTRLRRVAEAREVMATAAEMLGQHLRANRAGYYELTEGGNAFAVDCGWTDAETPSLAGERRIDDFGSRIDRELREGRTVRIDDALAHPLSAQAPVAAEFLRAGKRATIIAPLVRDGGLVAALYVHQAEPRHWSDDEVALIQEVAERTWTSILRARAETALRASEERFRQFAEHSSTVLWIQDVETHAMEYVSPAYEAIWGEPVEAALRDPGHWAKAVHPDDRDRASTTLERGQRGEEGTHEYHIIRPDGGVRWIRDTFFPIRDEQGRIRRIGGIAQDITQHDGSIVYVVDGDVASCRNLCLLLQGAGYEVQSFASAQSFLAVAPVLVPGCVVLDMRTPEAGGLTIPRELKARRAGLPVIVLGEAGGNVSVGVQAMKAGAVDFLDMPYQPEQVLDALASAQATIRERAEQDQATERVRDLIAALPPREREVLDGLLDGGTNKTIARDIGLSPRTVEAHRARIMERLGAQSLPELVQIAVAAGLQSKSHSRLG